MKSSKTYELLFKEEDYDTLIDIQKRLSSEVEKRKKRKRDEELLERVISSLKFHYDRRCLTDKPFDERKVSILSSESNGGYEAVYASENASIHIKCYLTYRLGDLDLFTDAKGRIDGVPFDIRGD